MSANTNVQAALAAAKVNAAKQDSPAEQAAQKPTKVDEASNVRIFHGEFPNSISLMTSTGVPVHFYAGFHVTEDPEVIEFLEKEKTVKDVTKTVDVSQVPVQPHRTRSRNWASASKFGVDPTVFSPADLLQRAVAGSNTLSTAAESNAK